MLRTYRKVTYTLVVTIKNSVVMDKLDNMELFQFETTIGLARKMLLYKSVQLLVMNERCDRGGASGQGAERVHVHGEGHHW